MFDILCFFQGFLYFDYFKVGSIFAIYNYASAETNFFIFYIRDRNVFQTFILVKKMSRIQLRFMQFIIVISYNEFIRIKNIY